MCPWAFGCPRPARIRAKSLSAVSLSSIQLYLSVGDTHSDIIPPTRDTAVGWVGVVYVCRVQLEDLCSWEINMVGPGWATSEPQDQRPNPNPPLSPSQPVQGWKEGGEPIQSCRQLVSITVLPTGRAEGVFHGVWKQDGCWKETLLQWFHSTVPLDH